MNPKSNLEYSTLPPRKKKPKSQTNKDTFIFDKSNSSQGYTNNILFKKKREKAISQYLFGEKVQEDRDTNIIMLLSKINNNWAFLV